MSVKRLEDEDDEAYQKRKENLLSNVQTKILTLTHAVFQVRYGMQPSGDLHNIIFSSSMHVPTLSYWASVQALLAVGLLQLRPIRPRVTAAFGIAASALNCYMLAPPLPKVVPNKPALKLT
jgi:hypothetical protein